MAPRKGKRSSSRASESSPSVHPTKKQKLTVSANAEENPEEAEQQMEKKLENYLPGPRDAKKYDVNKFPTQYHIATFVASILENRGQLGNVFAEEDCNVSEFQLPEEEQLDFRTCSARTYHQQISDLLAIVRNYLVIEFREWFRLFFGHSYNVGRRRDDKSLINLARQGQLQERSIREDCLRKTVTHYPDPDNWDVTTLAHSVRSLLFALFSTLSTRRLDHYSAISTALGRTTNATRLTRAADDVHGVNKLIAVRNKHAHMNSGQMTRDDRNLMRQKLASAAEYLGATSRDVRHIENGKPDHYVCDRKQLESLQKLSRKLAKEAQYNYDRAEREKLKRQQLTKQAQELARLTCHIHGIAQNMETERSDLSRDDQVVEKGKQGD